MRASITRACGKHALWPAAACAMLLGGCFFDQVQRSEESDIERVEHKQAALQSEQQRAAELKHQEDELAGELGERELSLHELDARVQDINAANGRAIAENEAGRARYRDMLARLHETNEELALAQNASGGSVEERRARIASLKAQIKEELDLLLR